MGQAEQGVLATVHVPLSTRSVRTGYLSTESLFWALGMCIYATVSKPNEVKEPSILVGWREIKT